MKRISLVIVVLFSLFIFSEDPSFARMGGGRSFGSRGSRSIAPRTMTSPPRTAPFEQARPNPVQAPAPIFQNQGGGGFFRNMAGGIAGGFLGSMLFRGMGYGNMGPGGGGGGGFGLLEILVLGGLIYLLYRFLTSQNRPAGSNLGFGSLSSISPTRFSSGGDSALESSSNLDDVDNALQSMGRADPSFNLDRFKEGCVDHFFAIQAAWSLRDLSSVSGFLTPEVYQHLEEDLQQLKNQGQINHLENIAVRQTEVVEAWQEQSQDFITLRFFANLVDYTISEKDGAIISGSKTQPVKFEEFWTYTKNAGSAVNSPWKLSAIQQSAGN